jgi:hypothetical protein
MALEFPTLFAMMRIKGEEANLVFLQIERFVWRSSGLLEIRTRIRSLSPQASSLPVVL